MEKEINRRKLENMICDFLKTEATCVIATCSDSIPRASTVEFFPVDLTMNVLKIIPTEIDYIDTTLGKKGYQIRQTISFL